MLSPKIKQEDLDSYYYMWQAGHSASEIRETLGLSQNVFEANMPYFLYHCRQKTKETCRNGALCHIELSTERRKEFLELVASGVDYPKAAKIMNIPLPTIMDIWFVEDPIFKDQVDTILDLMNAKVMRALYKKAVGYRTVVKSVSRQKGIGEKGNPIEMTTVTKTEKIVDGDFNAQKLWLINRLPDQWSVDGVVNREGNKGAIMKLLGSVLDKDIDDRDEEFNKEQIESEKVERVTP